MSQHSQHQSTARIRVPVGRSVLLNKDYRLNTSSSSKIFRQGGNACNLFDFDNQSAAFFCVDTIKYFSIPSVPSGLEEVKTRPQRVNSYPRKIHLSACNHYSYWSPDSDKSKYPRGYELGQLRCWRADITFAWLCPAQFYVFWCDFLTRCLSCTNQQMESLPHF